MCFRFEVDFNLFKLTWTKLGASEHSDCLVQTIQLLYWCFVRFDSYHH